MRSRGRAGRLVAAALVAWALGCFADGCVLRWERPNQQASVASMPASWAFGCPPLLRFQRFLAAATRDLPPGSRLAVAGPVPRAMQEAFYAMWAAYLLPEHPVMLASDAPPPGRVDYVLAYRRQLQLDVLEPGRRVQGGWVYPVRRKEAPR
ncbi:MAG: hypothetical protein ACM3OB_09680 [Acidobacteriota bacterium]